MSRGLGRFLPRPVAAPEAQSHERSLDTFLTQFQAQGGQSYTGYASAWQIPSAWRATTLLGGLIGGLPVDAYRNVVGAPAKRIEPTPIILANPVPMRSNVEVISAWVHDYLFHGNAVGVIASRDSATGWPTSVIPVPASWVSVLPNDGSYSSAFETLSGHVVYRINGQDFSPWEIFHVKGPCAPGALRGVGVLEAALATFTLANDQRSQASSVSAHGVPTGLLYADDVDVTPAEMKEGRSDFMRSQQDGRTIAALPPGVKFQALSWNPEELQLIEARKMSDNDMSLLFGLPASFLNVEGSSLTYSNIGQDALSLLKYAVNPIVQRFDQEWTRHLPRGTVAKTDIDAIVETDLVTHLAAIASGVASGVWTIDEGRSRLDLEPLPAIAPPSPEVEQALQLATAAPSLVQMPGLPQLVDQLRALNGKPPLSAPVLPGAGAPPAAKPSAPAVDAPAPEAQEGDE